MIATEEAQEDRRQRVLRERAERIAHRAEIPMAANQIEILVFQLLSESYAVETRYIREVIPLRNLAPVPCTPAFYLGLINLRGELCPVIDLRQLFNHAHRGLTNASRIVILRNAGLEVGVLADGIVGTRSVACDELQPLGGIASTIHEAFLRGYVSGNVIVIDAARILAHPKLIVNEQVEG